MFREVPDRYRVVGACLIVGSGIYALHREAVRRRSSPAAAARQTSPASPQPRSAALPTKFRLTPGSGLGLQIDNSAQTG